MEEWKLKHAREWGYAPRICYAKGIGLKCIEPNLTCDKCTWGNKEAQRFNKLKALQSKQRITNPK